MKKVILFILLVLLLPTPSLAKSYGDFQGAVYLSNHDGDTIRFNLPDLHPIIGEGIKVRINGIDSPEIKGKCEKETYNAEQARDMVADLLKDAEQIDLKNMKRGQYFWIAADVFVDGENLADILIEAGMAARHSSGKKTHSWCG